MVDEDAEEAGRHAAELRRQADELIARAKQLARDAAERKHHSEELRREIKASAAKHPCGAE
jgi:hypothetical protein